MYTNILIPTDGSELSEKAVQHGMALAKRIGAKAAGASQPADYSISEKRRLKQRRAPRAPGMRIPCGGRGSASRITGHPAAVRSVTATSRLAR
jgi:hypothetical protein